MGHRSSCLSPLAAAGPICADASPNGLADSVTWVQLFPCRHWLCSSCHRKHELFTLGADEEMPVEEMDVDDENAAVSNVVALSALPSSSIGLTALPNDPPPQHDSPNTPPPPPPGTPSARTERSVVNTLPRSSSPPPHLQQRLHGTPIASSDTPSRVRMPPHEPSAPSDGGSCYDSDSDSGWRAVGDTQPFEEAGGTQPVDSDEDVVDDGDGRKHVLCPICSSEALWCDFKLRRRLPSRVTSVGSV